MPERFKQRPLAMGVLTGVTALVGGIEPAAADIITLSQSFGTISVSDSASNPTGNGSGSFSGTGSDLTSFSQFNTLGGTRVLTGVSVTVTSSTSVLEATVSGSCANEGSVGDCGGSATNDSTFSVAISTAGPFSPLTQMLSTSASDSCTPSGGGCNYGESTSNTALPSDFTFAATIAQLNLFAGSGSFNVTPGISLAGNWNSFAEGTVFETVASVSANTNWSGTIDVEYDYTLVNGVPEPASLFLVGAGLAGLGFARRKLQRT